MKNGVVFRGGGEHLVNDRTRPNLRYRWTDLEEVHIFVVRLIKKGARPDREIRIFALFRRAEASP